MHMTFSYGGRFVEAVLLSATPCRLRVIAPDWCDALDLHYRNGSWQAEDGISVEIESLVAEGPIAPSWSVWRFPLQRTQAAGAGAAQA